MGKIWEIIHSLLLKPVSSFIFDSPQTHDFARFAEYTAIEGDDHGEHDEHCSYVLNVYPTIELESVYKTNQPVIFALIVVAAFLFTTLVFILYDVRY